MMTERARPKVLGRREAALRVCACTATGSRPTPTPPMWSSSRRLQKSAGRVDVSSPGSMDRHIMRTPCERREYAAGSTFSLYRRSGGAASTNRPESSLIWQGSRPLFPSADGAVRARRGHRHCLGSHEGRRKAELTCQLYSLLT